MARSKALNEVVAEELERIDPADQEQLVFSVIDTAATFFEGFDTDFGIQYRDSDNIIFGGLNRIVWSPLKGFRIDRDYCTPDFIAQFDKIMSGTQQQ